MKFTDIGRTLSSPSKASFPRRVQLHHRTGTDSAVGLMPLLTPSTYLPSRAWVNRPDSAPTRRELMRYRPAPHGRLHFRRRGTRLPAGETARSGWQPVCITYIDAHAGVQTGIIPVRTQQSSG